jgi:competence protein ComEC
MRVPAALVVIPLIAGSAIGLLWGEHVEPGFALWAASAGLIGLLSVAASLADDSPADSAAGIVVTALVLGLSLGVSAAHRAYRPSLLGWFQQGGRPSQPGIVLEGRLREDAANLAAGVSLLLDVDRIGDDPARPVAGGVRLSVAGALAPRAAAAWRAGRRLRVTATLREPAFYLDPGVPEERRPLLRRGIALVGAVKSGALVEVVAPGSAIDERAASLRAWARHALNTAVGRWSQRSAGVATAIVIGDRTGLSQDDERRLQGAGTYHVIAISGGNIAILTVMLLVLLRSLRVPPRLAAAGAIVLLLFYGRITGPSASVDRAVAAAVVVLAGRLIDQHGTPLNVLAVVAILGAATRSEAVFEPGFVLSFAATLAILVGVPRFERWIPGLARRPWIRPAAALLGATLSAEIALAPVSAALFARVTAAGLLLNFVAIPLMTIVQAGSLVTLALHPVLPAAASASGYATHLAALGLVESARLVEVAPWLARDVAPPAWMLIAGYYGALILSLCPIRAARPCRLATALFGCVIVAGPAAAARDPVAARPAGALRIVFIDVGQGDATLVILPDGRSLLVDAGGLPIAAPRDPEEGPAFDIGERVVARVLNACGVRRLEALVITHPDPDHLGGGRFVLRRFAPRAIWEGVPVPPHPARALLQDLSRSEGSEWRTVTAGDRVEIAGVEIAVLHPPLPEWERQRVRNDDSVVLAVRHRDVAVILPGDIGREGESRALARVEAAPLTILKAPHHGSATSSTAEFLAVLKPRAVIFSAGRHNPFGHPAPAVVARYRTLGAALFSTAEDGAVILDTDGRTVTLRGWTGRVHRIENVH